MIEWKKVHRSELKVGDEIFVFHDSVENMGILPQNPHVYKITYFYRGGGRFVLDHDIVLGEYGDVYKKVGK